MAAMRLISKVVNAPQEIFDHKHRGLLYAIYSELQARTLPFRVYKVKSHTGVVGNELADIVAKEAGQGEHDPEFIDTGANPHMEDAHSYWLQHTPTSPEGDDTITAPRIVGDMHDDLGAICRKMCWMGDARMDTIYYTVLQNMLPHVLAELSNKYKTSSLVPGGAVRTAVAYHSGCLANQKTRFRDKYADSPNCLLCGGMDGGHHAVSACPAMERPVTARHHGATRTLVKEILKGRLGTGLAMMDAGNDEKRREAGFREDLAVSVPAALFSPSTPPDVVNHARRTMKPDAIVVTGRPGHKTVHLVEVKYCRDTDRAVQETRAEAQHQELMGLLSADGQTTRLHTILLGVGGTIYRDTLDTLVDLGVDRTKAQATLERVSKYSVQQMYYIIKTRRGMEAKARAERGIPPVTYDRTGGRPSRRNNWRGRSG
jgi:hypothetical protein